MIYFDTDVLVHYFMVQDAAKHQQATQLVRQATALGIFYVSLLSAQETAFVLAKLKQPPSTIQYAVDVLLSSGTDNYTRDEFRRAVELASRIGFKNINDCLHTALAETYCSELYTYNHSDFGRIQGHTSLNIRLL
jgi:predicted nucleic acid-binding protein